MRPQKAHITKLDIVLLALIAAAGLYLGHRLFTELNYRWEWSVIPQYLFRYDKGSGSWVPNLLMLGLFNTIRLSFWSTILAVIFGTVVGLFRLSPSLFKRMVGRTYVEGIRNLPPLVLIFIFYFFLSDQIMPLLGLDQAVREMSPSARSWVAFFWAPAGGVSSFLSAVLTLAIYEGAYISEIVRSGIESVSKGQWEAGHALGLSWADQMRFVIMPQAMRSILPPLAGQFISAIKDSAIVSIISVPELTFQGMELMSATYKTFEVWITIGSMYLIITLCCSLAVGRLESRLANRGR